MAQTDATRVEHIHAWGLCRSDFECVFMTCGATSRLDVQAARRLAATQTLPRPMSSSA